MGVATRNLAGRKEWLFGGPEASLCPQKEGQDEHMREQGDRKCEP